MCCWKTFCPFWSLPCEIFLIIIFIQIAHTYNWYIQEPRFEEFKSKYYILGGPWIPQNWRVLKLVKKLNTLSSSDPGPTYKTSFFIWILGASTLSLEVCVISQRLIIKKMSHGRVQNVQKVFQQQIYVVAGGNSPYGSWKTKPTKLSLTLSREQLHSHQCQNLQPMHSTKIGK